MSNHQMSLRFGVLQPENKHVAITMCSCGRIDVHRWEPRFAEGSATQWLEKHSREVQLAERVAP